jgi:hypothetical protein
MVAFHYQMVDIYNYKSDLLLCCYEVDKLWQKRATWRKTELDITLGTCYSVMSSEKGTSVDQVVDKLRDWKMKSIFAGIPSAPNQNRAKI